MNTKKFNFTNETDNKNTVVIGKAGEGMSYPHLNYIKEKNATLKEILEKGPVTVQIADNNRIYINHQMTHISLSQTKEKSIVYYPEPTYIEIEMPRARYSTADDFQQLAEDLKQVL